MAVISRLGQSGMVGMFREEGNNRGIDAAISGDQGAAPTSSEVTLLEIDSGHV